MELHKDILIPVYPKGFKTVEDLKKGDVVFSIDGMPTEITGKTKTRSKKHYKITFLNGEVVRCNIESPKILDRSFVKYPSFDITSDIVTKSAWYAKGSISSIPDSYIYNSKDYVLNTLEGILSEVGYKQGSLYVIKHDNLQVLDTVKIILSILGIAYKEVSLFNFEHLILFESQEVLCRTFKKNLHSYLEYIKEEEGISLEANMSIVSVESIKDKDYYRIDTKEPFLITKSYIPMGDEND